MYGYIFILVAIPFLMMGSAIFQISSWVCENLVLSVIIYLVVSFICGIIFYRRPFIKHRICGVFASVLTMLPLGMGAVLYMIPYVLLEGSFSSVLDWILVAIFIFIIMFFIFSICNLLQNGLIHLIIGFVFFTFAYLFFMGLIASESDILSWQTIGDLYGFSG